LPDEEVQSMLLGALQYVAQRESRSRINNNQH